MASSCRRAGGFVVVVSIVIVAFVALAPATARGQTFNWTNGAGGIFSIAGNWSAGGPPDVATELAAFELNSTYTVTFITSPSNASALVNNGNVTFALAGQTYTLSSNIGLNVGGVAGQTGRLTVLNGHYVGDMAVGSVPGATGFLTIGADAVCDTGVSNIGIGTTGMGTLTIENGAQVLGAASYFISDNPTGNGTVTITGTGSTLSTTGSFNLALASVGTATVSNGGTLRTGTMTLASGAGARATLTVTGARSSMNTGTLALNIGNQGAGVVTVSAGASVTAGNTVMGSSAGATGSLLVTGAGSSFTNNFGNFNVGSSGAGTLEISAGAAAETVTAQIAANAGGTGTAVVTGAATTWQTSSLAVGGTSGANGGTGTLTVRDGASVSVGGTAVVRDSAGSSLTLEDGGSLTVGGTFTRLGTLNHRDGVLHLKGNYTHHPTAVTPLVIDGAADGDLPTLWISGTGNTTNVGTLTVGNARAGALILDDGRLMQLGANAISVGAAATGRGTVIVDGTAVLGTTSALTVGSTTGGAGDILITGGGRVEAGGVNLRPEGTIRIDNGTLRCATFNSIGGGRVQFDRGTVELTGTITLDSTRLDALLGPAHVLGGGRTISGALQVTVAAPLTLDGGELESSTGITNSSTIQVRDGGQLTLSGAATLANPAGRLITLAGTGALTATQFNNAGTLQLEDNLVATVGVTLSNSGLIRGSGAIGHALTNDVSGEVRAETPASRIVFNALGVTATNLGTINALDGGRVEFVGSLNNVGQVNLADGTFRVSNSLFNNAAGRVAGRGTLAANAMDNVGQMQFSGGTSDVFIPGGITNFNGARILVTGGSTTTFYGPITNNAGANIAVAANSSAIFLGSVTGAGTLTGSGTKYFSDGTSSVDGLVSSGASVVEFAAALTAGRIRESALTVDGHVTIAPDGTSAATSKVNALTIGDTGTLDLSNNKLIVAGGNVGTFAGGAYSGLTGAIARAYHFGSWDLPGIKTTQADAGPTVGLTTLAINTADETFYAGGTFGGVAANSGDVLIMYTYAGDANLDGLVDAADYGYIDNYFQFPGSSGFANGDFNYDGIIDAGDYGIIDNTFQLQGPPIPVNGAAITLSGVTAVPEPAVGAAAVVVIGGLITRRRTTSSRGMRASADAVMGR